MKEFLLGGLLTTWIVILGLSTLDTWFAVLALIYPFIVALLAINYHLLKTFIKVQKRKVRNHITKKLT